MKHPKELSRAAIQKLRNMFAGLFGLAGWTNGEINAATMALLEILAMVEIRQRKRPQSHRSFGVQGLDEMFGAADGRMGVTSGSSTVIVGGPGTGKSMLAYCFTLQGLIGEPGPAGTPKTNTEEDVILLSFDERHKRVLRDAGNLTLADGDPDRPAHTLGKTAASQILQSDIRVAPTHSRFRFVYQNPINVDLDRLVYYLTKEIEGLVPSRMMPGSQKRRPCRLVIDSLSDLERNIANPLVFNDFVTTLLNKAIDWNVTTLMVYEAPEGEGGQMAVGRLLSFMADNVILLRHVQVNNIARKCISIRKARGRNHDPSVAELVFEQHERDTFSLAVRKGFEGMSNVLGDQPRPARIDLRLFSENKPEKQWNRKFYRRMKSLYPDVRLTPFRLEQIRAAFWHRIHQRDISPDADVTIVSLDQPWVRVLAEYGSPLLSRWKRGQADVTEKGVIDDLLPVLRTHAETEAGMLALPLYHDIGLLLRRVDLLQTGKTQPAHWQNVAGQDDLNRRSLETVLGDLLGPDGNKLGKDVWGFAFDMDNINSVACVFIELCWNFGASTAFLGNTDEETREKDLQRATEAMLFLARLRWRNLLPFPCELKHCAHAVYSRLWYANLSALLKHGGHPELMKPVPFLPGASAREGGAEGETLTVEGAATAHCCCGAWYLGVLSSGGNANLGWSVAFQALEPQRVRDRATKGAGLPPLESFYTFYGDQKVKFLHETTFKELKETFYPAARSRTGAFDLMKEQTGEGGKVSTPRARTRKFAAMPEVLRDLVMRILNNPKSHPKEGDGAREHVRKELERLLAWTSGEGDEPWGLVGLDEE